MQFRQTATRLTPHVALGLVLGTALGNLSSNLMPLLLKGYAQRTGLSDAGVGVVATVQLLVLALATLAFAPVAARCRRVSLIRWGLGTAALGYLATAFATGPALLTLANCVTGLGLGLVFAGSTAAMASTPNHDRAAQVAVVGSTVIIAVLMLTIPWIESHVGPAPAFVGLAAFCVVCGFGTTALPESSGTEHSVRRSLPGPVLLGGIAVFGLTDQGSWSYADVLGERNAHLTGSQVAALLSVAALVALSGVALSALATRLLSRSTALVLFLTVELVAKAGVPVATIPALYGAAVVVWQVCYLGLLVQVLALMAMADASGAGVAAAGGALAIGTGLGPAVIGAVLQAGGPSAVSAAIALGSAAASLPLIRLAHRPRQRPRHPDPAAPSI
jgi:predicted MFS family arabinose efflux permease